MANNWKTVRVFISSTFRDMQAERDHLVRFVFPRLRQELLQRRIHLVDVDLRWGVTSEQDALSVCREVVDECQPRFLCMLGGRYGWVPPGKNRSITADEVYYGVLDRDLKNRGFAYFYFRDPATTSAMAEAAPGEFREPSGSPGAVALDELKAAIIETGLEPFTYRAQWDDPSRRMIGLKEFGDRVYADLKQSIDQEFEQTTGEKPDEFTEENAAMEMFIEERVQRFVLGSRQTVWNELRQHAESTGGNGYLCIAGAAGSGKSALLGKFCQDYREAHPQDVVIPHFVGASPGSTDVRRTLRRLCHELAAGAGLTVAIPKDPEKLRVAFAEILKLAGAKNHVVILLDAINQFDPATQLAGGSWLPEELPDNARIILSTMSEVRDQKSEVSSTLESLRHRRIPPREIELKPLTAEDAEAIIREFLNRYRKSMTHDQRAALLAKADAGTPLYLLVALEELRTLGTYEEITDRIAQLPPDTRALFIWILKRLEDDDGFRDASGRKIGPELVSRFVSLLGVSRHGLSQQELVELLSPGDPQGNVAALAQLLRPYLMQRGELLDFYHGQFREAVTSAFLLSESQRLAAHDQLATYFRALADPEMNQNWKGNYPRPFLEVVFHLVEAQLTDEYCQILCDLRFVEARCRLGQVFELIADYRLAQENLPEAQTNLREERERHQRTARWTREIIAYAKAWSDRRDLLAREKTIIVAQPQLPESPSSCHMWTEEEIMAESRRLTECPTRLDRLIVFSNFVRSECYPLLQYGEREGFVLQHAFNFSSCGAVADASRELLPGLRVPVLLRRWPHTRQYHPKAALLSTLTGHTLTRNGIVVGMTADGRRAISGSDDLTLRVWDLETGACTCVLAVKAARQGITSMSVTPDGRRAVLGMGDGDLQVWDSETGRHLRTLKGYGSDVTSVSVTPDGRRAVAGSRDKGVRLWDLETGTCLCPYARHLNNVATDRPGLVWAGLGVSVTADGRRAISGGADNILRVWDLETGIWISTLEGHDLPVNGVSVTPDGRRAVSASDDKTVRVWDVDRGTCVRTLNGHGSRVLTVSVTPDGQRAVSGSSDGTLRVWDLETGTCLRNINIFGKMFINLSVTPDGRRAVSNSGDKALRVWDLEKGLSSDGVEGHKDELVDSCLRALRSDEQSVVAVTSDKRRALSWGKDKTARHWDLESGTCLHVVEYEGENVQSVTVTPDGRRAVTSRWGYNLRLWDLENGGCGHVLEGHDGKLRAISTGPDGQHTLLFSAAGRPDGQRKSERRREMDLQIWDLEEGKCLRVLQGHKADIMCVAVIPDRRRVVSGCLYGTLKVWDIESGACLHTMKDHCGFISDLSVTPDGRRAVSASDDTLRVWDLESGECVHRMRGHVNGVGSVRVTLDGLRAVSRGSDDTLRVWNLETGECVALIYASARMNSITIEEVVSGLSSGAAGTVEARGLPSGQPLEPDTTDESYERVLRHGLEWSRREEEQDNEDTLGHLTALASQLDRLGKHEEASLLTQERAAITGRKASASPPQGPGRPGYFRLWCEKTDGARRRILAFLRSHASMGSPVAQLLMVVVGISAAFLWRLGWIAGVPVALFGAWGLMIYTLVKRELTQIGRCPKCGGMAVVWRRRTVACSKGCGFFPLSGGMGS